MLGLIVAAASLQAPGAAPQPACHAVEPTAPRPSGCPEWRYVQTDQGTLLYVDPASLRRAPGTIEIDTRAVAGSTRPEGLRSVVARLRYDCATHVAHMLHLRVFDAAGVLMAEGPPSPRSPSSSAIARGTPIAALFDSWCRPSAA